MGSVLGEQIQQKMTGSDEMEERKTGFLFQDSWQLSDNISVRYAIRYKEERGLNSVAELEDVFIDLEDCLNLLTIYQDESNEEPTTGSSISSTVWAVKAQQRELKYCPLIQFVYQAALLSRGNIESQVFQGILKYLVRNLVPGDKPNPLLQYSEVDLEQTKPRDGSRRKRRKVVEVETDLWCPGEESDQGCDKRLRMDKDNNIVKDEDGDFIKNEPQVELLLEDIGDDWENLSSSEEEIKRKPRGKPGRNVSCDLCSSQFKTQSSLHNHKVRKHSDSWTKSEVKPKPKKRGISTCKICGEMLSGLSSERKHYAQHHPDRTTDISSKQDQPNRQAGSTIEEENQDGKSIEGSCKECGKVFATVKHLFNHCKREHPDLPEICPVEPVRLGPIRTLHERLNDQGDLRDQFQCGLQGCSLTFERFLSLVDHERTGHPDSYICILCGLACFSADMLITHSDNNHEKKSTYICRVCGFFNRNSRGLMIHTQQEHMKGTVLYQCEKCVYTSENYVTFGNHKRTAHLEDNSKFVCEECGNNFATKQSLSSHRRLHNPEFKRFACKYCPQRFGHSSVLLIHMRVHTGEKPFSCNLCGATFGSQTASIRHRRVVHAEESEMAFQCADCGKKYPSRAKQDFENHCKTHSGVRDHVCELCGSAYFSKKGLRKHERASHPALKPSKPKPFKIGEDIHVQPGTERRVLELHELNRTAGLEQNEFLNLEARHFMLPGLESREQPGVGILGANHLHENKQGAPGVHGVGVEGLNSQVGREEGFTLHRGGGGGREGDMNLQMVYGSGLNRAGGDPRLTQFFSPLANQN